MSRNSFFWERLFRSYDREQSVLRARAPPQDCDRSVWKEIWKGLEPWQHGNTAMSLESISNNAKCGRCCWPKISTLLFPFLIRLSCLHYINKLRHDISNQDANSPCTSHYSAKSLSAAIGRRWWQFKCQRHSISADTTALFTIGGVGAKGVKNPRKLLQAEIKQDGHDQRMP